MDEVASSFTKPMRCNGKRKLFTALTIGFFIMLLTFNICCRSSVLGDASFFNSISNYLYGNILDEYVTNTSEQTTNFLVSSLPASIHVNPRVRTFPVSTYVNPHDFKYLILESSICDSENGSVYFMVVVCTAPANFRERMTIRETWGSVAKMNKEIGLIFMIGQTLNDQVQNQINNESSIYHDIVQEDFLDSYRNLSIKSAALLKWSFTYCPSAKYVLKADDDMFINIEYLLKILKRRRITNAVIGDKITRAKPIRNETSKWYTPRRVFNGRVYPPYTSGTSYVLSGDILEKLYNITLVTPLFWLEDIYISGICRSRANIRVLGDYRFTMGTLQANGCVFRRRFTGHQYTEIKIRKIWKEFIDKSLKC